MTTSNVIPFPGTALPMNRESDAADSPKWPIPQFELLGQYRKDRAWVQEQFAIGRFP